MKLFKIGNGPGRLPIVSAQSGLCVLDESKRTKELSVTLGWEEKRKCRRKEQSNFEREKEERKKKSRDREREWVKRFERK